MKMVNFNVLVKSKISPPLAGGDNGEGGNNLFKFLDSSPSPSPVKGEEVFLTFYENINFAVCHLHFALAVHDSAADAQRNHSKVFTVGISSVENKGGFPLC